MTIGGSNSGGGVQPTYAFHVARAYAKPGIEPARTQSPAPTPIDATRAPAASPAQVAPSRAQPAARCDAGVLATVGATPPIAAPRINATSTQGIDRLVGATVSGKASPDFTGSAATMKSEIEALRRSPSVLPLYQRPTDRNTVETVLLVGRTLDTRG
ncbi:MAG: hypothetical protein K2X32_04475 [Phycisphaerales bacterium]|nr:hypothetical protein [Phycisphaerales bacterium]